MAESRFEYPLLSFRALHGWLDISVPKLVLESEAEIKPNVSVYVQWLGEAPPGLDRIVTDQVAELKRDEALGRFELVAVDPVTVDGCNGQMVRYRFVPPWGAKTGEPVFECLQVFVIVDQAGFTITFTALASDFDGSAPKFDELLGSLRFKR